MVKWLFYMLLCIPAVLSSGYASPFVYNLDVAHGLPSNHIYGLLVDRNGYLWITTPEGVVRYNGYGLKVFNTADGLPTSDVWEIFEDSKGRLWLMNFSQSLGYIANDRYTPAVIRDPSARILPQPQTINNYNGGVFIVSASKQAVHERELLVERNDTFYTYSLDFNGMLISRFLQTNSMALKILASGNDSTGNMNLMEIEFLPGTVQTIRHRLPVQYNPRFLFGENILLFSYGGKDLLVYNAKKRSFKKIALDQPAGNVKFIPGSKSILYLLADGVFYKFDDTLGLRDKWDAESRSFPPVSLSWIAEDPLWGMCMGVAGQGVYIPVVRSQEWVPVKIDVAEHYSIGVDMKGNHYWWNTARKQLVILNVTTGSISRRSVTEFNNTVIKLLPYGNDYSLLIVSMEGIFRLDHRNGSIERFPVVESMGAGSRVDRIAWEEIFRCDDILLKDTTELYLISRQYGLVRIDLNARKVRLLMQQEDFIGDGSDYKQLVYDPVTGRLWAYGNKEAICYETNDTGNIKLQPALTKIRNPWLSGIEQVVFDDRYGNVFIKRAGDLYMLNRRTGIVTVVNKRANMDKGMVFLKDSLLIAAGRFGMSCFLIRGPGQLSHPVVFEQFKDQYYSAVTDIRMMDNSLYLITNNGVLKSTVPSSAAFDTTAEPLTNARLIAYSGQGVHNIVSGDTLHLAPNELSLGFDLINPVANGTLRFNYHLTETGEKWQKSGSNELMLSSLKPDKFYTLHVQVRDNALIHNARVYLYVVPHWYQTVWMQRLFVISGILVFILLAILIAWLTRLYMKKENFRKNLRMEIELKSIYAQINPHFIYNTLNAILMMIRLGNNNDAFYNVSKFSKLLRAYIKSSRNRYITVGEEIENLKNYIELQQARFGGRFGYNIIVEDTEGGLTERRIPSLLLQPIVENAVNHGLFHKEGTGNLEVIFKHAGGNSEIICIIEDDGVGREEADKISRNSTIKAESYGTILIEDLISILNRYEQADIRIEYIDKQYPLTGAIVKLYIK